MKKRTTTTKKSPKDRTIHIRMNSQVVERLQLQAAELGLDLSSYIRMTLIRISKETGDGQR